MECNIGNVKVCFCLAAIREGTEEESDGHFTSAGAIVPRLVQPATVHLSLLATAMNDFLRP